MNAPSEPVVRARRRGRRIVLVIFGVVVSGITLNWTVEIVRQAFVLPPSNAAVACRPGVLGLIGAIRRARSAADAEVGGERAAVNRFRSTLEPEWSQRGALTAACHGDPLGERALREVDRLRFAEEHATRHEAVDLAPRRRGVLALERQLAQR